MSTAGLDPDLPSCQKQDGCQLPSTVHKTRGAQTHTLNRTHVGLDFLRQGNGWPIFSMKIYPSSEWCWTFKTRAAIRAHWLSHLALISGKRQFFWVRGFGRGSRRGVHRYWLDSITRTTVRERHLKGREKRKRITALTLCYEEARLLA